MAEDQGTREKSPGRAPATSHAQLGHIALELFTKNGYDETTIDEIAAAAGIGRRTFFRYFPSKHDLPWGEFDALLDDMRATLAATDPALPLMSALHLAIRRFNTVPAAERDFHRDRMELILHVPSLNAYSLLKYTSWRQVVAEFAAARMGKPADSLTAQTIAWACMGLCIASYEKWLQNPQADLLDLLDDAFAGAQEVFGLTTAPTQAAPTQAAPTQAPRAPGPAQ